MRRVGKAEGLCGEHYDVLRTQRHCIVASADTGLHPLVAFDQLDPAFVDVGAAFAGQHRHFIPGQRQTRSNPPTDGTRANDRDFALTAAAGQSCQLRPSRSMRAMAEGGALLPAV